MAGLEFTPVRPSCRHHFLGHRGMLRFEGRHGETGLGHRLPHAGGGLEEPGKIVQHLLRSRAGKNRHQGAAVAAMVFQERFVERVLPHFVEERMADKRRIAAALAEPGFFERQAAQHVVAQPSHFLGPPRCPGPDLRRRIVEDRDAVDLGPPGDPPIEARIVDQHDGIGPVVAEIAIGPAGQVPELVEVRQGPAEPHDGQFGQIGVELAADRRHPRTTVADGLEPRAALLQLANEVGGVQVAAGFTGAEEQPQSWRGHAAKYRRFRKKTEDRRPHLGEVCQRFQTDLSNYNVRGRKGESRGLPLAVFPLKHPAVTITCLRRVIHGIARGPIIACITPIAGP